MVNYADWIDGLRAEKSRTTYQYCMRMFSDFVRVTPDGMRTWTPEEAEDRLLAFRNRLSHDRKSGATISLAWMVVKKWLEDNRIPIRAKCGVRSTRTVFDYIPTSSDLKMLLEGSKLLYRTAFGLIAFSGMRPVDVRNLRFENVKASLSREDEVITMTIRQEKTGEFYTTFLGPQGSLYLRKLLDKRRAEGENISDKTFVISHDGRHKLPETALRHYFDRLTKRTTTRFPTGERFRRLRLYSLRKYFRMGVSNILGESEAEYLMGHAAGITGLASTYSGLREMDPRAIGMLKAKYIKALPKLETELTSASITGQMDTLSSKVALLEGLVLKNGLLPDRERLREMYLKTIGTSGGKSVRHEWSPDIIAQDIETGANRDPLDDLSEEELDQLFIRALRRKMMNPD